MSDGRQTKRLCAQVRRIMSQYLSLETADEVLQSLFVETVEPSPDDSCLLVRLNMPQDLQVEIRDVMDRLQRAKSEVRAEIARAINRRKTPDLLFVVV